MKTVSQGHFVQRNLISKEARNDMEEKQEVRKVRRIFTPEQKFEILT